MERSSSTEKPKQQKAGFVKIYTLNLTFQVVRLFQRKYYAFYYSLFIKIPIMYRLTGTFQMQI